MNNKRGKFIVFEGIDGSGKSTISRRLAEKLNEVQKTELTYEPTDNMIGSIIRQVIKKEIAADEKTIGALFLADRLHHIQNEEDGMLMHLNNGSHVICDRYYYSSYAYHVPYLSMDWVIEANSVCASLLRPDIVLYLNIPIDASLERIKNSRTQFDLFETKDRMTKVMQNYEIAIRREGFRDNVIIINADRSEEEVFEEVWKEVGKIL